MAFAWACLRLLSSLDMPGDSVGVNMLVLMLSVHSFFLFFIAYSSRRYF
jgi:hypothetical protein